MEKRPNSATQPQNNPRLGSPEVIWPACGAFCDIFWWARRKPDAAATEDSTPAKS
jgi:hypothetical protein